MPSSDTSGSMTGQTLKYKFCYESSSSAPWNWCEVNAATLWASIYENFSTGTDNVYYFQYGLDLDSSHTVPSGLCTIDEAWPGSVPPTYGTEGVMTNGKHGYIWNEYGIRGINFRRQDENPASTNNLGKYNTCYNSDVDSGTKSPFLECD